jgi:DNA-binding GntR family transcriptional regulator
VVPAARRVGESAMLPRIAVLGEREGYGTKGTRAAKNEVFERLRAAIAAGEIRPLQKLVERQIAQQFGVSRTPVREAIQRLAAEGYVSSLPAGGVVVVDHLPEDIEALYEIRQALEGRAARLAATRASTGDLAEIARIDEQLVELLGRGAIDEAVAVNDSFHNAINAASKNARLQQLILSYKGYFFNRRLARLFTAADWEQSIVEHQRLLAALRERDGPRAEEEVWRHLQGTLRIAMQRL